MCPSRQLLHSPGPTACLIVSFKIQQPWNNCTAARTSLQLQMGSVVEGGTRLAWAALSQHLQDCLINYLLTIKLLLVLRTVVQAPYLAGWSPQFHCCCCYLNCQHARLHRRLQTEAHKHEIPKKHSLVNAEPTHASRPCRNGRTGSAPRSQWP